MISEAERAYAAGFLDGEGCISIIHGGRNPRTRRLYWVAAVYATQVDPAPLLFLRDRWGGSISRKGTAWQWSCRSQKAYVILRDVLPYLIVKRGSADNALRLATMRKAGVAHPLTEDELAERRELHQESKRLNQTSTKIAESLPR